MNKILQTIIKNYDNNITAKQLSHFDIMCYEQLLQVPAGKITTYGHLGKQIAKIMQHSNHINRNHNNGKQYSRAVGGAMNRNKFAPEIPCHRVVRSDGKLGGYNYKYGGLNKKITLLQKEGINIINNKVDDIDRYLFTFD